MNIDNELAEIANALATTHTKYDPCTITITEEEQLFLQNWWKQ